MPSALIGTAVCSLLLALAVLIVAWGVLRRRHWFKGGIVAICGVLLLKLAALTGTIALATRGYRPLAAEQLAATLRTEPLPNKHFHATVVLPGQPVAMFDLAGDLFSIDAHILRWRPIMSIWGLGTAYQLTRVSGRKQEVAFSLAPPQSLDMYHLVKAFPLFRHLVDAEQRSASVTATGWPANFDVLVSPTGLLIRPAAP
jgi:hypothetical protein